MDAYEATRLVFSRMQSLDPENASKIMGLLLMQEHGEKEMIRLAFGPESLLQAIVLKARKHLNLPSPPSSAATPLASPSSSAAAPPAPPPPFLLARQNSSHVLLPSPLAAAASPSPWAPPSTFSRSDNGRRSAAMAAPTIPFDEELLSPGKPSGSPFFNGAAGAGDPIDDFRLQDQLSYINDPVAAAGRTASGDFFFSDSDCQSPSGGNGEGVFPYGMGWGVNSPQHRRSLSAAAAGDIYPGGSELGWKPCLYFAKGYCKNGTACRFLHELPDEATAGGMAHVPTAGTIDAIMEQQRHELLQRSKSQRIGGGGGGAMSQLMASAFPYSPTGSVSASPSSSSSSKCLNFLLQQQQTASQRAATMAAAAALMLGDDGHRFLGRSRIERDMNSGSRQIYLTFPADSTFSEEDVANYFSIYGPVQDVRIPYQQKRMFGFVTFVYPETAKLILAKGNPHFVCSARVLVKPYKEKGKVPDRKQQQQAERGDFSGCTMPNGLVDSWDSFDLRHLGAKLLYGNGVEQELLLRKKLEEHQRQHQAMELKQAIELQRNKLMGLQLLSSSAPVTISSITPINVPSTASSSNGTSSQEHSPTEDKSPIASATKPELKANTFHGLHRQIEMNAAGKEEPGRDTIHNRDSGHYDSSEHNLPNSPFDSPTKSSIVPTAFTISDSNLNLESSNGGAGAAAASVIANKRSALFPAAAPLDMASLSSCFLPVPRFSSGHGATGI